LVFHPDKRRLHGPKREEATAGRVKLHNAKLHNLYSSPVDLVILDYNYFPASCVMVIK
jgi:hypothetical protein